MTIISCECGRFADTQRDLGRVFYYKVKFPTLRHTERGERIIEEYFYLYVCPYCEKSIVLIKRKALNGVGNRKALMPVRLSGIEADEYLARTKEIRSDKTDTLCYMSKPQAKIIDLCYGKTLNSTTQRRRYVNETGYSGEKIKSEIKIIKL